MKLHMAGSATLIALGAMLLSGCVAKTAFDLATAPVRMGTNAVGKSYDMLTTSQSEADEKRGRAMRKHEERLGKLDRRYREQGEDCRDGDEGACRAMRETADEIDDLREERP